jgi:hypothetical protein
VRSTRLVMRSASALLVSALVFVSVAITTPGVTTATRPGQNGVIAYEGCTDTAPIECGLMFMNGDGTNRRLFDANAHGGRWSPDGRHMLFSNQSGGVTVYDTQTKTGRELITNHPFGDQFSAWSPDWSGDASKIAFIATGADDPEEEGQIYIANVATGALSHFVLPSFPDGYWAEDLAWSPNGIHMAVRANGALYIVDFGGLSRFIGTDAGGSYMSFSPDGRYIAGTRRDLTSEAGVTVTDLTTGSVRLLSDDQWTSWSPDGEWIAYGNGFGSQGGDVYRVHPDGSDLQRLTDFVSQTEAGGGTGPDWQCVGPTCLLPLDTDVDGVRDTVDNCIENYNPDQLDNDRDGQGNACDETPDGEEGSDVDADGVPDDVDNCPGTSNPDQADTDGDGTGNACEDPSADGDGDGVIDEEDNCPEVANADQADADGDDVGDACEEPDDCLPTGTDVPVAAPAYAGPRWGGFKWWEVSYGPLVVDYTAIPAESSDAICMFSSDIGTIDVFVDTAFLPKTRVATSTTQATIEILRGAAPVPSCDWVAVSRNCVIGYESASAPMFRWHAQGFIIKNPHTGLIIRGGEPLTFYATLAGITSRYGETPTTQFRFVQLGVQYVHETLVDVLGYVDKAAIVQDPPADVLVTDASGRRTGRDASGAIHQELPNATYIAGDGASAVFLTEPDESRYDIALSGDPGAEYFLMRGWADMRNGLLAATQWQDESEGTLDPSGSASYTLDLRPDEDDDGVPGLDDLCPETVLPDSFQSLKSNRYAANAAGVLVANQKKWPAYGMNQTAGCSAKQIIAKMKLGKNELANGLTRENLELWISQVGPG